jgi:hypothetical protein
VPLQVNEAYQNWQAPRWVYPTTRRLLASVDERHLRGLSAIVLTNRGAMNSARRRGKTWSRGRKVQLSNCLGLYHPVHRGQEAWIEIFVDQIETQLPGWLGRLSFVREIVLGSTLFHELGHHIHYAHAPEHRERENVAESWSTKLKRASFRRRHPFLCFILPPLLLVSRLIIWTYRKFWPRRGNNSAVRRDNARKSAT